MRFLHLIAALAAPVALLAQATQEGTGSAAGNGNTADYQLVWQDLFDDDELNPQRWNIEVNGAGGGNNELQYYTDRPENVRLGDDGDGNHCLILTARRESYQGKHFTSGRITSMGLTAFTHGKIEASIKLPSTANGLWPAFWMMGNDYPQVGWPACGETDILEMGNTEGISAGTQDRYYNGACHWGEGWPQSSYVQSKTQSYSLQDGEYHIITCIWNLSTVSMYIDLDKYPDQKPYFKMTITAGSNPRPGEPGYYFHKPNFILFNLAVGGSFTGIANANAITALDDSNGNEASMYVNWVKIYQLGTEKAQEELIITVPSDPTGAVAAVDADSQALRIEDGVAYGDGPITVYDLAGGVCLRTPDHTLALDSLSTGLYLVSSNNQTLKHLKR